MWMEEDADKRVNEIRAKEAAATGCGTLAVGCPFCSTMMEDGLKSIDSDMEVMDIAELMWNQMKKNLAEAKKINDLNYFYSFNSNPLIPTRIKSDIVN